MLILALAASLSFSFSSKPKEESKEPYLRDYNSGVFAQKSGDYQQAIQYYLKSVDQKSDFADAWNNLGYCYRMTAKQHLAKSGDAYDRALKINPKHEGALEYQGEYFLMVGQISKAYLNYQTLKGMESDQAGDLKDSLDNILKQSQFILKSYSP